jgi:hypothetical protein
MCDYSLQGLPNRLAVQGEHLITYRFRTGSIGLAAPAEIARQAAMRKPGSGWGWWAAVVRCFAGPLPEHDACAVCIPPGARLLMSQIPEGMRMEAGLKAEEYVTFAQLSAEFSAYRDAIRFDDGTKLVLQSIPVNVMFEVLSTGPSEAEDGSVIQWLARPWPVADISNY